MSKFLPIKGTKDLLPDQFSAHDYIIKQATKIAHLYNFEAMSTPIFESTNIYQRTLGDSSDVVSKEMYSFNDKGGDQITLRPEFTAGVVRSFISNGLQHQLPVKFFSHGPVFRHDRPQAGRQRQFHQLNFEYIGASTPYSDAETIYCAVQLLDSLNILNDTTLEINSLGCSESRKKYQDILFNFFLQYKDDLSQDSQKRLSLNPLRILDSKDPKDQILVSQAPKIKESYTDESREYFEQVLKYLDALSVKYVINERLVRGLDYYTLTAFEFTTDKIGAQSTILAGGRYDDLIKMMGGPHTPAFGFAAGIERLCLMRDFMQTIKKPVYIIPIDASCESDAIYLAQTLRLNNINCHLEIKGKFAKRLQKANDKDIVNVIFIGPDEISTQTVKLKNLKNGSEQIISKENLLSYLINTI